MPRGRHRHSPPLHRLLPPSAIAGVSVVCALAPWVFTQPMVLRGLAAAAAATAVVGGVVMRRWDAQAGKQVADLTRARASDEWRHEERVAELETDLEESRELRVKLEQRLRAKRAELAGLRNEHASLLRRYATAETERASVLEERRVLEIEAGAPARALPPGAVPGPVEGVGAVAVPAQAEAEVAVAVEVDAEGAEGDAVEEAQAASAVFSPEGSRLFLRAKEALARFDEDGESLAGEPSKGESAESESPESESSKGESSKGESSKGESSKGEPPTDEPPNNEPPKGDGPSNDEPVKTGSGAVEVEAGDAAGAETEPALEDDAPGKPEAVDGHERAAAGTPAGAVARTAQQPSGHFIAPTAVAVAPAAPVRRPAVQGGFDFFGTKRAESSALESVQNEDLADVVGQEALALHKAEAEAEFKPADEESRGVGQVIDLTAHDETEQIDVQGLRSAVS
ncbi:hypothetical protein [Streptomyces sp. NBC_00299]|uniref:hypothetical protein n=1 Tax=Streptomyces sp. NBC_00299 TaxID=2975705 RepID=UPI002E2D7199|nr:hypothetical protein [Streptomyces sp. NBC_00299]